MSETQTCLQFLLLSVVMQSLACGQSSDLLTGSALQQELKRGTTLYWSDSPLRESMLSLTTARRVPIWIDRRCAPQQAITLTSQDTLEESLWQLSRTSENLDIAWSDNLIYVGPTESANRWATVNRVHREMVKELPRVLRNKWNKAKAWRWERLTNPQDLLRELEAELGHPIENGERVLHDLWPAAELPELPLFARLELLLSGFDCSFTFDATGKPVIREMPQAPRFTKRILSKESHQQAIRELLAESPTSRLNNGRLTASWRTHEACRRVLRPRIASRPNHQPIKELRFTLRAKDQPLGPFLKRLMKQLQVECEFSPMAESQSSQMISFNVEKVDLPTLVAKILMPTSLDFTLKNRKLMVRTKDELQVD